MARKKRPTKFTPKNVAEEWKYIDGHYNMYEVSSLGNIRNTKSGNHLKGTTSKKIRHVHLVKGDGQTNRNVCYLVADHFLDNPEGYNVVKHIDGNTLNNNVSNLKWVEYYIEDDKEGIDFIWKIYTAGNRGNQRVKQFKGFCSKCGKDKGFIDKRLIHTSCLSLGLIRHELTHAYVDSCLISSSELSVHDIEEVFCEINEAHLDDIKRQSEYILNKLTIVKSNSFDTVVVK